jgi:uncharacterized protein (TIGR02284 family)
MTDSADLLKDVVHVATDGAAFYEHAAKQVSDPALRGTFERMAERKRTLIAALSGRLAMLGEDPPAAPGFAGTARRFYADLRSGFGRDPRALVAQLEEMEDRLVRHYESALAAAEVPEIRSQLEAHRAGVLEAHEEMRRLKRGAAA